MLGVETAVARLPQATQQAGVGALLRAETRRHLRVGNVIDLVRARTEQNAVRNAGHMAGHATAGVGRSGVMCVRAGIGCELRVALQAHAIRLVTEFQ